MWNQNSDMCLGSRVNSQFTQETQIFILFHVSNTICIMKWVTARWADVKYKRPVDKSRGRIRMVEHEEWRGWRDRLLQQEHLKLTENTHNVWHMNLIKCVYTFDQIEKSNKFSLQQEHLELTENTWCVTHLITTENAQWRKVKQIQTVCSKNTSN